MTEEKLPLKSGCSGPITDGNLNTILFTQKQAERWGEKNFPAGLKRIGFKLVVSRFNPDTFYPDTEEGPYFRVNYGK
jgi:hypothetical protein